MIAGAVDAAAEEAGEREQVADQFRHDADVALAAAQGPEEFGVLGGVGLVEGAVGGDDLEGADVVGCEAVCPAQEREAAADRVADDAGAGARTGQGGQAVGRGCVQDVAPPCAGCDRGGASGRVYAYVRHAGGVDQKASVHGEVRAVAGGLDGDGGAGGGGPAHRGRHVGGVGRSDDHVGGVQGGQVEAGDLIGVAVVAGA